MYKRQDGPTLKGPTLKNPSLSVACIHPVMYTFPLGAPNQPQHLSAAIRTRFNMHGPIGAHTAGAYMLPLCIRILHCDDGTRTHTTHPSQRTPVNHAVGCMRCNPLAFIYMPRPLCATPGYRTGHSIPDTCNTPPPTVWPHPHQHHTQQQRAYVPQERSSRPLDKRAMLQCSAPTAKLQDRPMRRHRSLIPTAVPARSRLHHAARCISFRRDAPTTCSQAWFWQQQSSRHP